MRTLAHYTLSFGAAAALLTACGGSQPPIGAPGAMPQVSVMAPARAVAASATLAKSLRVLHSFGSRSDGQRPQATLIDVAGMLYGTTYGGGDHGPGTVYRISTNGAEKVLYSFVGRTPSSGDGANPVAPLTNVRGTLYGTTLYGGDNLLGTVYRVTTSGKEQVLHTFGSVVNDGAYPSAPLIALNGTLYGTTQAGGAGSCYSRRGCGTVYSITKAGKEHVLYSFDRNGDGTSPVAGLLNVNGTLYGTTDLGGAHGLGTVYRISTNGSEKVLYSFAGSDGSDPSAELINVNGTLYGTTSSGGANNDGTVFSITTSGKETVLHSFAGKPDGAQPKAHLINVNGTLYGTTENGGAYCGSTGCGTVFSITLSGKEKALHSFSFTADGAGPAAAMTDVNGTLYGTTLYGGTKKYGTVFALKP